MPPAYADGREGEITHDGKGRHRGRRPFRERCVNTDAELPEGILAPAVRLAERSQRASEVIARENGAERELGRSEDGHEGRASHTIDGGRDVSRPRAHSR